MEAIAGQDEPTWRPKGEVPSRLTGGTCYGYGLTEWGDLFTPRQLVALTTFSELVAEARTQIHAEALTAGLSDDPTPLYDDGFGASAYAEAVVVYLGIGVSKLTDYNSSLVLWSPSRDQTKATFARQALPMVWDFAAVNPLAEAAGDLTVSLNGIAKAMVSLPSAPTGHANQADAAGQRTISTTKVISTDPPYYDNIGYADLSDFFMSGCGGVYNGPIPLCSAHCWFRKPRN